MYYALLSLLVTVLCVVVMFYSMSNDPRRAKAGFITGFTLGMLTWLVVWFPEILEFISGN